MKKIVITAAVILILFMSFLTYSFMQGSQNTTGSDQSAPVNTQNTPMTQEDELEAETNAEDALPQD